MKKIILLFGILFLHLATNALTTIPAGNVSGTWTLAGSPYQVLGHITVPANSTLIIQPGVTVSFQGHYKLNVLGQLLAIGTATDTIVFTAANTTIGWCGIRYDIISSTQDSSIFKYCKIQYGKATGGSFPDAYGGAICLSFFSKVRIANCFISNNTAADCGGGIYCGSSSPIIANNTICNNIASNSGYGGGGIYCVSSSSPTIKNNTIRNNTAWEGGGIFCYDTSSPIIENNTISNNVTSNGSSSGGGISCDHSSPIITSNTISNNTSGNHGGGIFCFSSSPTIINNTISNNTANDGGGGIYCYGSSPTIRNSTISNNKASISGSYGGGALGCAGSSNPLCCNVLFWGNIANGNTIYLNDNASDPYFSYCNVQGGIAAFGLYNSGVTYTGIYTNNIDVNPLFVSPSGGAGTGYNGLTANWSLQLSSPCIDAGNPDTTSFNLPAKDMAGNPRVTVCRVDIGSYEYQTGVPFTSSISITQPILCNGAATGSAMISVTGGSSPYTYIWNTSPIQNTATAIGLSAGTYSVTAIESSYNCSLTNSIFLTQPAKILVNNPQTICNGSSYILNGHTYTTTGNYIDTLISVNGCDSIITTQLTVNPLPPNTISSGATTICQGQTATLNANTGSGLTYQWYLNGVILPGITSASYQASQQGTYMVILTNSYNCSATSPNVNVIVNSLNDTITPIGTTTFCQGQSVTLYTYTTHIGIGALSYTWSPSSGLSSTNISSPVASPQQTTTYTLQVTDGVCTSSDSITVTVNSSNFSINFTANTQLLYNPPFAVQFTNTTPSMSNYNFTWYFGDGVSLQSNNATVFHQYAQNGLYDVTLVATNIATGCTDTKYQSGYIYCAGGTSCTQTATISQANPVNGCVGTPVMLSCNTVAGATYQWNYNGTTISGNDTTIYYANASGNYSVTIILNSCPVTSSVITVNLNNPPATPTINATGSLTYCGGGSATLTAPAGATSYLWSNGATTQSTVVTISGNYTVQVSDANGCVSQSQPYLVGASPLGNPDICIVSVDSITGHNIIIWNKNITTAINLFNIYGQGNQSNIFNLLGSVPYSSISTYIDNTSNPAQQAYLYKISAVDTCSAESALSSYHETIHLSINQGMGNTYNLMWNYYVGFTFPSYNIYRGTSPSNMTLLTTLASTLNSYTDLTPPSGYVYYQIEAVNPNPCTPSKSTYNSSRSNIASNNVVTGIHNYTDNIIDISIYPNPATDNIFIEAPQKTTIEFLNIQGQLLKSLAISDNKINIDISAFPSGMYFVKVKTEKGIAVKKFIKE